MVEVLAAPAQMLLSFGGTAEAPVAFSKWLSNIILDGSASRSCCVMPMEPPELPSLRVGVQSGHVGGIGGGLVGGVAAVEAAAGGGVPAESC